jgi:outer membrane protein OmpA-like peptidoglycan-associated protein/ABC-type nitrate/sulfonate/bicarbonate transport system substrate-binding protein
MAARLTPLSKVLITAAVVGAVAVAVKKKTNFFQSLTGKGSGASGDSSSGPAAPGSSGKRPYKVALSQWPGHMAIIVGNGGLKTQPGSAAADEGLDLEVVFIEEPVKKNAALQSGNIDFVWQTIDELPINMGGYKSAKVDARAFLQIDWSRGGDACISSKEVKTVENVLDHKSAMMMFSPDHTVFEFMINNSRLTPDQIAFVRKQTSFSMDDFTYGRVLFTQGKVDVACLWEPDVTLALNGRPGSHRLFSTADATELIADMLLARMDLLTAHPEVAEKVAKVWFAGVKRAQADMEAAARLISTVAPRFRDEMGYEKTLQSFKWVKWTDLGDNVAMFGMDGRPPSFDRVYNQADTIWTNYPQAEIKDRFAPSSLRYDGIVRKLWEAEGRQAQAKKESYEPKIAATGTPVFTKPVTINFNSGSSELDSESMAILNNQLLPQLEMARGMYVRVEGNTDSMGSRQKNKELSEKRAKSIVDFLVTKGLESNRIVARGNGDDKPVSSNKTADGRASNRRTDILFISSASAANP